MSANKKPLVGIVMGSASDKEIMAEAVKLLEEFGVACEVNVISAHRTPEKAYAYAKKAQERGLKVLVAGAGLAAHLPGVLAALTTLPVIGVPLKALKSPEGLDSLLSIVQMPPGVPVATVGIDSAKNAAILAVEILALSDSQLAKRLESFKNSLKRR